MERKKRINLPLYDEDNETNEEEDNGYRNGRSLLLNVIILL